VALDADPPLEPPSGARRSIDRVRGVAFARLVA
jgi:hypothetical protein